MIWFRAALLATVVGIVAVALTQRMPAQQSVEPAQAQVEPTARPTRVPLPTLPPEAIISRISRATPVPPTPTVQSGHPEVDIVDYGFAPAQLTIPVGTTLSFVNVGSDGHDVTGTGPGGDWRSGPLAPSERYSRPFGLAGTYTYVCTIHPEMSGRIVVQP